MPSRSNRTLVSMVVALVVSSVRAAGADGVVVYQNGFESADTCAWTTTVPTVTCDPEMVYVPPGDFTMGSDFSNEQPAHVVYLDAFWIDRTEVTVEQYDVCVAAGGCALPDGVYPPDLSCNWGAPWDPGDHPINCVEWFRGEEYCAWAGKRYPTEAEWEKAARGADARTYPWGEETPTCDYTVMNDPNQDGSGCGLEHTAPVGSKPAGASPYGALDMAGNVWEWVNDQYDPDYYSVSPYANPPGPEGGDHGYRVLRGGNWLFGNPSSLSVTARIGAAPDLWLELFGFRCARDG